MRDSVHPSPIHIISPNAREKLVVTEDAVTNHRWGSVRDTIPRCSCGAPFHRGEKSVQVWKRELLGGGLKLVSQSHVYHGEEDEQEKAPLTLVVAKATSAKTRYTLRREAEEMYAVI